MLSLITGKDGWPVQPMNFIADVAAGGCYPAIGILIALLARERTGEGQYIDFSYLDGTISILSREVARHYASKLPGGEHVIPKKNPLSGIFKTKDKQFITFSLAEERFWTKMWKLLGRDEYVGLWRTPDTEKISEMSECFRRIVAKRTRTEWEEFLQKHQLPGAPVSSLDEAMDNPQIRFREMLVEVNHPQLGPVTQVGTPVKLSRTPGHVRSFAPKPGQDNTQVLRELGYSDEQIARLREHNDIEDP
jgi:crotonobetainyl-CoA:carnitine CoA-transferase CaiB-like acyl-CoA transferase